ncbi:MAG TPA: tetratricopeptide repeat protein [Terriglobales bacterium]|nr:tetratricopeptide repeat protein [Terriglobales bacterium]
MVWRRPGPAVLAICALAALLCAAVARADEPAALEQGRVLVREGRLEAALAIFDGILARAPSDLDARKERGRILGFLKRYAEALDDLARVLAVTPADSEARTTRARILAWTGRYDAAEAELRRALVDHPEAAETFVALGDVLAWQGRTAEAALAYTRAHALAPADAAGLVGLARLRYRAGDLPGAQRDYRDALALDPGSVEARDGLAQVERALRTRRFRVDLGYRFDRLDLGNTDWHQGSAQLTFRPVRGTSLFLGVDQYHRFDRDDTQITLGGAQRLPLGFGLGASVTVGPDAAVVARRIYDVEGTYEVAAGVTALLRYRRMTYAGDVSVDLLSPGVELTWPGRAALLARYYVADSSASGVGHAGSLRLTLFPDSAVSPYVGAAYGRETFVAGTVEQVLTATTVATGAVGVVWRFTEWSGLRLEYTVEDRRGSYTRHGVGSAVFIEF